MALCIMALGQTDAATPIVALAALLLVEGVAYGLFVVAYTDIVTGTLARRAAPAAWPAACRC